MTWKEYIEGRKWYRGTKASEAPTRRAGKVTYWTPDKKLARGYADPRRYDHKHPMQLITAKITPTKLFVGNDPAIVRKLGIEKRYDRLVAQGKKWDKSTDKWIEGEARKAGYDVQIIDKKQLVAFKPRVIKIVRVDRVSQWHGLRVPPGTYYTSGGRISRNPRRGWRTMRFT
ncbi:hypothetical protein [Candidatus Magnetobacterium casense]|uniref:Uncharacterized protein n=1 Tax=Candidatus Magnetobacterium casense TaxID=1455061 RepID=A0ABS6S279_9BACT|nr:hypothetical protein [Candidatus Magnetobacterium casensis]MBV6342962.1 hypothetical protein [Candidatus Magnetobacterium casensis]